MPTGCRFDGSETRAGKLLDRFVELYGEVPLRGSMIEPGLKLWRDYWIYTRQHMILTDEGWEPGEALASYAALAREEGLSLADMVRDGVNWQHGDRKFPRIFPKKKGA